MVSYQTLCFLSVYPLLFSRHQILLFCQTLNRMIWISYWRHCDHYYGPYWPIRCSLYFRKGAISSGSFAYLLFVFELDLDPSASLSSTNLVRYPNFWIRPFCRTRRWLDSSIVIIFFEPCTTHFSSRKIRCSINVRCLNNS